MADLVSEVANAIRIADGDHTMGAAQLAEVAIAAIAASAEKRVSAASTKNYANTKKTRLTTAQIIAAVLDLEVL